MGIRQPPSGIRDPNLRGFLQELRNAVSGLGAKVDRLVTINTYRNGGGGGGSGGGGGGSDGGGDGGGDPGDPPINPPVVPIQPALVLTASPSAPMAGGTVTLTAAISGNNPTGAIYFYQDGDLMTLDPVPIANGAAAVAVVIADKGDYTFVATYPGDANNLSATSNTLVIRVGSDWDGAPPPPTNLTLTSDAFSIYLKWDQPYIGDYAYTEVWGVVGTNDVGSAEHLADIASTYWVFSDHNGVALDSDDEWYFWVRIRDTENLISTWCAANAPGWISTTPTPGKYLDKLAGAITETELFPTLGDKITLIGGPTSVDARIAAEALARADADGVLAQQISLISAGAVGFDVFSIWYFDLGSEVTGWTFTNCTGNVADGLLTLTGTAANPTFETATFDDGTAYKTVSGATYSEVHIRAKRLDGTGWLGRLTYTISGGGTYTLDIAEPTPDANGYMLLDWELGAEANWTGNTITKLKFQLGTTTDDDFALDWLAVGRYGPAASYAQVVDYTQARVGYATLDSAPTLVWDNSGTIKSRDDVLAWNTANPGNPATWHSGLPVAQAVKQVAVSDGVSSVALEQRFIAQKSTNDSLYAQYTVKIDNNGYVSGFGLASAPASGSGKPYSDFMVRADRFSIVSPTVPTSQWSISGNLTHNGVTASVTLSSYTSGLAVNDVAVVSNVDEEEWNRALKVTGVAGSVISFAVGTGDLQLNPAAAASAAAVAGKTAKLLKVKIPFVVLTSTDANGTPPGVYMSESFIKYAVIEELMLKDGAATNLKIGNIVKSTGFPDSGYPTAPFSGWRLRKDGSIVCYGSFELYDATTGDPIISAGGNIAFNKFMRLILTAQPAEKFTVATTGTITPSSITVIATAQNIGSPTITWTVTQGTYNGISGPSGSLGTGSSKVFDPTLLTTGVLGIKVSATVGSVLYEDTLTIAKLQEGSNAITVILTNDSHAIPAGADGSTSAGSYTNSGTDIYVYEGAVLLAASAAANGAFQIGTLVGTNITPGSIRYGAGGTGRATIGTTPADGAGTAHSAMTQDTASITIPLVIKKIDGTTVNITKTQTFSKSKAGAAGTSGFTAVLSNESHTFPCSADGTVLSFAGSSTTVQVYEGTTLLAVGTAGGSAPATPGSFNYAVARSAGLSGPSPTTAGQPAGVLLVGDATGFTTAYDTATLTLTLYVRSIDGTVTTALVKVQSFSKAKDGLALSLSSTAQVIKGSGSPTPTQFTLSAIGTVPVARLRWAFSNDQTATPTFSALGAVDGVASFPVGANAANAPGSGPSTGFSFPESNAIQRWKVWDANNTGLYDVITISRVSDGAPGAPGAPGTPGTRGSVTTAIEMAAGYTSWDDAGADYQILTVLGFASRVVADTVTEWNANFSATRAWNGTAWVTFSVLIDGNVVMPGSLTVNKLNTQAAWAAQITLASGTGNYLQSQNFVANTSGFRIDGSGNAEFQNLKARGDILLGGGNVITNADLTLGSSGLFCVGWEGSNKTLSRQTLTGHYAARLTGITTTSFGILYWQRFGDNVTGGVNLAANSANKFHVAPGRAYQVSAYVASFNVTCALYVRFFDSAGTQLATVYVGAGVSGKYGTGDLDTYTRLAATILVDSASLGLDAGTLATVAFAMPMVYGDNIPVSGYIQATRMQFLEVPIGYTPVIPWSPGGVSLVDTLAMRQNSATQVQAFTPGTTHYLAYSGTAGVYTETQIGNWSTLVQTTDAASRVCTYGGTFSTADTTPAQARVWLRFRNSATLAVIANTRRIEIDTYSSVQNNAGRCEFTNAVSAVIAGGIPVEVAMFAETVYLTGAQWDSQPWISDPYIHVVTCKR